MQRLIKSHQPSFEDAPAVSMDGEVRFLNIDAKDPTWFYGTDEMGVSGYFPVGWFTIDAKRGRAVATRDYNAMELTVEVGDRVEIKENYFKWVYVLSESNICGWIPRQCLEPHFESELEIQL